MLFGGRARFGFVLLYPDFFILHSLHVPLKSHIPGQNCHIGPNGPKLGYRVDFLPPHSKTSARPNLGVTVHAYVYVYVYGFDFYILTPLLSMFGVYVYVYVYGVRFRLRLQFYIIRTSH